MSSTLNTLIEGVSEIQRGNFSTAIELLEEYCQNYKPDSEDNYSEYIYAQQHIVKAYGYLGDKSKAIQRTKELAINGTPSNQKMGKTGACLSIPRSLSIATTRSHRERQSTTLG